MVDALINIEGLDVWRGDKAVLKDVNVKLNSGQIVGVIGPNGAGKTTLMEAIAARLPYKEGSINANGAEVADTILKTRSSVSFATEPLGLSLALTGRRYLDFVAAIEGYRALTSNQVDFAGLTDLADHLDRPMKTYSHGMLKKLSVAASLNDAASIYIYDEIFNGLDILSLQAMKGFFKNIAANGKLIIICSHFLQILFEWCDEVVLVNNQTIAKHWDTHELEIYAGDYNKFQDDAARRFHSASA